MYTVLMTTSPAIQPQYRKPELLCTHSEHSRGTGSRRRPISYGLQWRQRERRIVRPTAAALGHVVQQDDGLAGDRKVASRLSEPTFDIRERDDGHYANRVQVARIPNDTTAGHWLKRGDGDGGDLRAAMHQRRFQDGLCVGVPLLEERRSQGLSGHLQQQQQQHWGAQFSNYGSVRHQGSMPDWEHQFAARELLFASTSMSRGSAGVSTFLNGGSKGWVYLAGIAMLAAAAAVVAAVAGRLRGRSLKETSAGRGMAGQVVHDADAEPVEISIASFQASLSMTASEGGAAQTGAAAPAEAGAVPTAAGAAPAGRVEAEQLEISIAAFEPSVVTRAGRAEQQGAVGRDDGSVSGNTSRSKSSSSGRSSKDEEHEGYIGFGFLSVPINTLKHGATIFSGLQGHEEGDGEKKHNDQTSSGNEGEGRVEGGGITVEGAPAATTAKEETLPVDVAALQSELQLLRLERDVARSVAEGLLDENQRAEVYADTLRMRLVEEAGRRGGRSKQEEMTREAAAAAASAAATFKDGEEARAGRGAGGVYGDEGQREVGMKTFWSGNPSEEEAERKSQEEVEALVQSFVSVLEMRLARETAARIAAQDRLLAREIEARAAAVQRRKDDEEEKKKKEEEKLKESVRLDGGKGRKQVKANLPLEEQLASACAAAQQASERVAALESYLAGLRRQLTEAQAEAFQAKKREEETSKEAGEMRGKLRKAESELSAVNIVAFRDMAQQLADAQRKAAEEGRRQGEMATILAKMMTDMPQAQEELAAARKNLEYEQRMRKEETEQLRSALTSAREEAASLRVECVRIEQQAEKEKVALRLEHSKLV